MGCLKIPYDQGEGTIKSSPLKICRDIEKNPASSFFCVDYIPFGGQFNHYDGGASNKYLYNGKELQDETQWYDYGQRMQDPWLGRFFNVDRFAEKYYDLTPYHYAANNPILYIDVNGDSIKLSDAFQNNEVAMTAYNKFAGTDAGKLFTNLFGDEGEYSDVMVTFDLKKNLGAKGRTTTQALDGESGEVNAELVGENSLNDRDSKGISNEGYRSSLKGGESLGFLIELPTLGSHPDLNETSSSNAASTLVHEAQHVKIDHAQIRKNGRLTLSPGGHHRLMKSNVGLVNERIRALRQLRPLYRNMTIEKVKKTINSFEN